MFDFFKKSEYKMPEPVPLIAPPVMPLEPETQEHYRVGFNSEGETTLTLMSPNGMSMTLTLNRNGCEQLIKMLRATYSEE